MNLDLKPIHKNNFSSYVPSSYNFLLKDADSSSDLWNPERDSQLSVDKSDLLAELSLPPHVDIATQGFSYWQDIGDGISGIKVAPQMTVLSFGFSLDEWGFGGERV